MYRTELLQIYRTYYRSSGIYFRVRVKMRNEYNTRIHIHSLSHLNPQSHVPTPSSMSRSLYIIFHEHPRANGSKNDYISLIVQL
jgi:hypothetical protein